MKFIAMVNSPILLIAYYSYLSDIYSLPARPSTLTPSQNACLLFLHCGIRRPRSAENEEDFYLRLYQWFQWKNNCDLILRFVLWQSSMCWEPVFLQNIALIFALDIPRWSAVHEIWWMRLDRDCSAYPLTILIFDRWIF